MCVCKCKCKINKNNENYKRIQGKVSSLLGSDNLLHTQPLKIMNRGI